MQEPGYEVWVPWNTSNLDEVMSAMAKCRPRSGIGCGKRFKNMDFETREDANLACIILKSEGIQAINIGFCQGDLEVTRRTASRIQSLSFWSWWYVFTWGWLYGPWILAGWGLWLGFLNFWHWQSPERYGWSRIVATLCLLVACINGLIPWQIIPLYIGSLSCVENQKLLCACNWVLNILISTSLVKTYGTTSLA